VKSGATPGTILWQSIPRDSRVSREFRWKDAVSLGEEGIPIGSG
jgi:hypothetical protein